MPGHDIKNLDELSEMEALRELFEKIGFFKPDGYYRKCLEEQREGKRLIYGAFYKDSLAGYCMLNWKPKYNFFKKFRIPEIQDLNVIPAARRKGIATALIEHCEGLVRKKGGEQLGIGVGLHSDYGPAQRLYTRLGYFPDGCGITYDRETVRHGEFRPIDDDLCLMMVKDL